MGISIHKKYLEKIMEKLGMLISKIYLEGRISENEAGRLSFYGLYNNEYVFNNIYDVDETCVQ